MRCSTQGRGKPRARPLCLRPCCMAPKEEELSFPLRPLNLFLGGDTTCLVPKPKVTVWSGLASMEGGHGDKCRLQSGRSLGKEPGGNWGSDLQTQTGNQTTKENKSLRGPAMGTGGSQGECKMMDVTRRHERGENTHPGQQEHNNT